MQITHDIPSRLLTSERARREAFTPIAKSVATHHGHVALDVVLAAMESGWQFAVGGADEAEKAAAASR